MSIKVALIARTGLGNYVFKSLVSNPDVILHSICTRKFVGKNPYDPELPELWELALKHRIKCYFNVDVNDFYCNQLANEDIDIILVASFDQILRYRIINLPRYGTINLHPSLLPKNRGPSPLTWTILNGDKFSGLTAHFVDKGIDSGDILYQVSFEVHENINATDLRKDAYCVAEKATFDIIDMLIKGSYNRKPQDQANASYYPKPTFERHIDKSTSPEEVWRAVRAFCPYPGVIFHESDKEYLVSDYHIQPTQIGDSTVNKVFLFRGRYLILHLSGTS